MEAPLSVCCFSIVRAKPFTAVLSTLKYNMKHDWQFEKLTELIT